MPPPLDIHSYSDMNRYNYLKALYILKAKQGLAVRLLCCKCGGRSAGEKNLPHVVEEENYMSGAHI